MWILLFLRYACDMRVIRLLRERGLGNSPTRVIMQLRENHSEQWLHRLARYTTQCVDFLNQPGVMPVQFQEPPEPTVVPSCKWLLTVYSQDILTRLDEIHARITSTYGSVLKMDSTKKVSYGFLFINAVVYIPACHCICISHGVMLNYIYSMLHIMSYFRSPRSWLGQRGERDSGLPLLATSLVRCS